MAHLLSAQHIATAYERAHLATVQRMKQGGHMPVLAIITTLKSPVIDLYIRIKKRYAEMIGCEVREYFVQEQSEIVTLIQNLNQDKSISGILVQLPLATEMQAEAVLSAIAPEKDVDGLRYQSLFTPPTAQAIMRLMDEYVPNLEQKMISVVGAGKLVGKPLISLLEKRNIAYRVYVKGDSLDALKEAPVIVTATGVPGLLTIDHCALGAYIFDAGTAEDGNSIVGDVDQSVYEREDVYITPQKGGIGMLTVRFLFENTIQAQLASLEH